MIHLVRITLIDANCINPEFTVRRECQYASISTTRQAEFGLKVHAMSKEGRLED